MVKHKLFGMGEVIHRETVGEYTYLTARFETGKEIRLAIPASFETGTVEALGPLKDEVEQAIAQRKARFAAATPAVAAGTPARMSTARTIPSGPVASAFEAYLIQAGYSVETDSGNPSTVYSYLNAVESVRTEEGVSWDALKTNIDSVVDKYDEGGAMSWFGAKSNKTVINALRRFSEFAGKP